jgi:hypothetical protein
MSSDLSLVGKCRLVLLFVFKTDSKYFEVLKYRSEIWW